MIFVLKTRSSNLCVRQEPLPKKELEKKMSNSPLSTGIEKNILLHYSILFYFLFIFLREI
ncbi:hypothetical protein BpHYR1_046153 [Brachionus plicatilis]|uniref:Uncharacterized protein n=1 Tax=Brachionus plicatilis TaxID=10195 RepID=A0A3M7P2E8_BRAPC|nr:hypothetical protein BpHYR1_046153 [Brachionus plicatilis]